MYRMSLKCCVCSTLLTQYIQSDGKNYCSEKCYETSFPKCCICDSSMQSWTTTKDGKKYCSEACLENSYPKCCICGTSMQQWRVSEDGKKYCSSQCLEHSYPKCGVCNIPMKQWTTTEDGKNYCSDRCLETSYPKCNVCDSPMQSWTTTKDGKKYCSEKCLETTYPNCHHCNAPMKSWLETKDKLCFCSETCYETILPKCFACDKPMSSWHETQKRHKYCSSNCAKIELPVCECCGSAMARWYENEGAKYCSERCIETERRCNSITVSSRERHLSSAALIAQNMVSTDTFANNYKVYQTPQGHGWAAENANHEIDRMLGKNAKIIGDDNALNGPDRYVDGNYIQTKYCAKASNSVAAAFEDGKYKYLLDTNAHPNASTDSKVQQLEVPRDQYEQAVKFMEKRIETGQVPGVDDPKEARNIVKKGEVTYPQAENIAKFGTVESVIYDVEQSLVDSFYAGGISSLITFAQLTWQGAPREDALKQSVQVGLENGGKFLLINVLTSQVSRTSFAPAAKAVSDVIVKQLPKSVVKNLGVSLGASSQTAAKQVLSRAIQGNIITGTVTVVVLSAGDITKAFNGKISKRQLLKNVSITTSSVASGIAGTYAAIQVAAWAAGGPVTGVPATIIGFVGASIGAMVGQKTTSAALSGVKDDSELMLDIFQLMLTDISEEFMFSETELDDFLGKLSEETISSHLGDMYSKENKRSFTYAYLKPLAVETVSCRPPILDIPNSNEYWESATGLIAS